MLDSERFFANVDKNGPIPPHRPELGPCHVWTGFIRPDGYGHFRFRGKMQLVHRVAFFLAHGRWPEPCGCHHCDNRACCNEAHIFEGSVASNNADMLAKGRHVCGMVVHPERAARGERVHTAKLTAQQVRDIRANYALCRVTQRELAERFGVDSSTINRIVRGKRWRHITQPHCVNRAQVPAERKASNG